jgi:hypothetical protein
MDASAGSGNASGGAGAGASACCYYSLLGIRKNASATDVRAAYRRLAMVRPPPPLSSPPSAAPAPAPAPARVGDGLCCELDPFFCARRSGTRTGA